MINQNYVIRYRKVEALQIFSSYSVIKLDTIYYLLQNVKFLGIDMELEDRNSIKQFKRLILDSKQYTPCLIHISLTGWKGGLIIPKNIRSLVIQRWFKNVNELIFEGQHSLISLKNRQQKRFGKNKHIKKKINFTINNQSPAHGYNCNTMNENMSSDYDQTNGDQSGQDDQDVSNPFCFGNNEPLTLSPMPVRSPRKDGNKHGSNNKNNNNNNKNNIDNNGGGCCSNIRNNRDAAETTVLYPNLTSNLYECKILLNYCLKKGHWCIGGEQMIFLNQLRLIASLRVLHIVMLTPELIEKETQNSFYLVKQNSNHQDDSVETKQFDFMSTNQNFINSNSNSKLNSNSNSNVKKHCNFSEETKENMNEKGNVKVQIDRENEDMNNLIEYYDDLIQHNQVNFHPLTRCSNNNNNNNNKSKNETESSETNYNVTYTQWKSRRNKSQDLSNHFHRWNGNDISGVDATESTMTTPLLSATSLATPSNISSFQLPTKRKVQQEQVVNGYVDGYSDSQNIVWEFENINTINVHSCSQRLSPRNKSTDYPVSNLFGTKNNSNNKNNNTNNDNNNNKTRINENDTDIKDNDSENGIEDGFGMCNLNESDIDVNIDIDNDYCNDNNHNDDKPLLQWQRIQEINQNLNNMNQNGDINGNNVQFVNANNNNNNNFNNNVNGNNNNNNNNNNVNVNIVVNVNDGTRMPDKKINMTPVFDLPKFDLPWHKDLSIIAPKTILQRKHFQQSFPFIFGNNKDKNWEARAYGYNAVIKNPYYSNQQWKLRTKVINVSDMFAIGIPNELQNPQ